MLPFKNERCVTEVFTQAEWLWLCGWGLFTEASHQGDIQPEKMISPKRGWGGGGGTKWTPQEPAVTKCHNTVPSVDEKANCL